MRSAPLLLDRRLLLAGLLGTAACKGAAQTVLQQQPATGRAGKLITAARAQIGVTLEYDPAYTVLDFPGGDVPRSKGVCTDVVIRAYRDAFGTDLQSLVNADMRPNFGVYPKIWGLTRADKNIDHRRVPNLRVWMKRKGHELPLPDGRDGWQPGDVFTSLIGEKFTHIGIVSDRKNAAGTSWMIIHNIGSGAREEDRLFEHRLTGRYRINLDT